jgi:hypothetical protein
MRTKLTKIAFSAALALATAFTLSCSDSGGGSDPIKKARITGVSQKGPFVEGSKATLYELNSRFEQTGRSFTDIIADSKGSFEIRNVDLASPYAMLEANGYYRNENTGEISKSPITLFAIADLREKDQINVNILTHLEYYRVLSLADQGKSVKEAKKQAQKEIFAVFGIDSDSFKDSEDMSIFGASESDAALLAISVLLQGDLGEGDFSQRLTSFSQAIKTGGNWSDEGAKAAMADWALSTHLTSTHCYYDSPSNCWAMPTKDMCSSGTLVTDCSSSDNNNSPIIAKIKNNILAWGLSSEAPAFQKYVSDYWNKRYEFRGCNASNNYETKMLNDVPYVCKDNLWQNITDLETYCLAGLCKIFTDPRDNEKYKTISLYSIGDSHFYYGKIMVEPLRSSSCPAGWDYEDTSNIGYTFAENGVYFTFSLNGGAYCSKK